MSSQQVFKQSPAPIHIWQQGENSTGHEPSQHKLAVSDLPSGDIGSSMRVKAELGFGLDVSESQPLIDVRAANRMISIGSLHLMISSKQHSQ